MNSTSILKKIVFSFMNVILLLSMRLGHAEGGVSIERGEWNHAYVDKIAIEEPWAEDSEFLAKHDMTMYWELNVADLHGSRNDNIPGRNRDVTEIGFTPVIRWIGTKTESIFFQRQEGFFTEIGIGVNNMASRFNNNGRVMGSCFQFGDHFGVGYKFENGSEITLKFQHFSNAGFREPNPAINFATIKFGYFF